MDEDVVIVEGVVEGLVGVDELAVVEDDVGVIIGVTGDEVVGVEDKKGELEKRT